MADQWHDHTVSTALVRDDDDIPDDWENEPEEKPKKSNADDKPKVLVKAPPSTKNKATKKKYLGDEHASDDEFLESLKEPNRIYTPEELDELRKRAEFQQEELKLNMVSEFVGASGERHSLDNINLQTKDEFLDYSFRLYNRLELLSKMELYPEFLDHLLSGLTKSLSVDAVKRLTTTIQTELTRKQTEEREKRSTKIVKKPVKAQLRPERRTEYDSFVGEGISTIDVAPEYDEDNDFM